MSIYLLSRAFFVAFFIKEKKKKHEMSNIKKLS